MRGKASSLRWQGSHHRGLIMRLGNAFISLAQIAYLTNYVKNAETMSSSLYFQIYTERLRSLHFIKCHSEENIHLVYDRTSCHTGDKNHALKKAERTSHMEWCLGWLATYPPSRKLHGPEDQDDICWAFLTLKSIFQILYYHSLSNLRYHYFMDY